MIMFYPSRTSPCIYIYTYICICMYIYCMYTHDYILDMHLVHSFLLPIPTVYAACVFVLQW